MANQEQSAEEIFGVALDLPPEDRSAYLAKACRGSSELRSMVEQLLSQDGRLGSFLAEPPFNPEATADASNVNSPVNWNMAAGKKLGRYTIVEPIGSGGLGA